MEDVLVAGWEDVQRKLAAGLTFLIFLAHFEYFRRILQAAWASRSQERLEQNEDRMSIHFSLWIPFFLGMKCFPEAFQTDLEYTELFFTSVVLFLIYCVLHEMGYFLTTKTRRDLLRKHQHNIGAGLAQTFFSFAENAIVDAEKAINKYAIGQYLEPSTGSYFGSRKCLILFPDLTSAYYDNDQPNTKRLPFGLLYGMAERDELATAGCRAEQMTYDYHVNGTKRTCYYHVFKVEDDSPNNSEKKVKRYFCILDNRPLEVLRRWADDKGKSKSELYEQCQRYRERLQKLLQSNPKCKGKYKVFPFDGSLTSAVKKAFPLETGLPNSFRFTN